MVTRFIQNFLCEVASAPLYMFLRGGSHEKKKMSPEATKQMQDMLTQMQDMMTHREAVAIVRGKNAPGKKWSGDLQEKASPFPTLCQCRPDGSTQVCISALSRNLSTR